MKVEGDRDRGRPRYTLEGDFKGGSQVKGIV